VLLEGGGLLPEVGFVGCGEGGFDEFGVDLEDVEVLVDVFDGVALVGLLGSLFVGVLSGVALEDVGREGKRVLVLGLGMWASEHDY
jgi:hypothetical protein